MRKGLVSVFCLLVCCTGALLGFASCKNNQNSSSSASAQTSSSGSGSSSSEEKSVYEILNGLAEKKYATVNLELTVTQGENSLTSSYLVSATENGYAVEYTYMRVNTIEEVDGVYILPEEYASEYTGSAVYENGELVSYTGAAPEIKAGTSLQVRFEENYFSSWEENGGTVKASVADVAGFLGGDVDYSDVSFVLVYNSSAIQSFTLNYTDGTAQVVAAYSFG